MRLSLFFRRQLHVVAVAASQKRVRVIRAIKLCILKPVLSEREHFAEPDIFIVRNC